MKRLILTMAGCLVLVFFQAHSFAQNNPQHAQTLADIQYELDTCPFVPNRPWLNWSCYNKQEKRLMMLVQAGAGKPSDEQVEAARILAKYRRRQFSMQNAPLSEPLSVIACLQTDKEVVLMKEDDFERVKVGLPFGRGFIAGLNTESVWLHDEKGLRSVPLTGLPVAEENKNEEYSFILHAAGPERPILKLLGESLGLTLSGNISENRLEGVWYGRSEAELFYNLLEDRGYRFMQDGKMVVFPSLQNNEAEIVAKIAGLRRHRFIRRLMYPESLQYWQFKIDEDVLISQKILDLVKDDDFDLDFVLQALADEQGLCYLSYLGNYHVGHCTEITRRKTSNHRELVNVIFEYYFDDRIEENVLTMDQVMALKRVFESDYILAHYFVRCVRSVHLFEQEFLQKFYDRLDHLISLGSDDEKKMLFGFRQLVALDARNARHNQR